MKIGISTAVVDRGRTGIARYVFALVRALLDGAPEHQFVLYVMEDDVPLFGFAADRAEIVRIPEVHRSALRNILWHQLSLPHLARRHGLDVLHVPSYRRLLWTRPCAMVGTIHDLAPFHVKGKYDWKRMLYGTRVARWFARRQHRIIAVSRSTARDIHMLYGVPEDRITVVHNGLDHSRFFPGDRAAARTRIAATYGLRAPFFVYVARIEHPGKNHVRLVRAFSEFKSRSGSPWTLALAGTDCYGAEEVHRAIRESRHCDDIRAVGFVADADLPDLYRAAEALVFPSRFEGFGFPPLEAMACGCPVLCSDAGSLPEVVGNSAYPLSVFDVGRISDALEEVASDSSLRDSLRRAGLARAQEFRWERTALQTLEVYRNAICDFSSASARASETVSNAPDATPV